MAAPPRVVQKLTRGSCCHTAAVRPDADDEAHGTKNKRRRWFHKLMCNKTVKAVRPSPRRTTVVAAAEQRHCDVDEDVEQKRVNQEIVELQERIKRMMAEVEQQDRDADHVNNNRQEREVAEHHKARRRRRRSPRPAGGLALQNDDSRPNNDDRDDIATDRAPPVNLGARPKKGILKKKKVVRPAVAAAMETEEGPTFVEVLFPLGVLSEQAKESFRSSGPDKDPAFMMFAKATAKKSQQVSSTTGSGALIDRHLVDQWSEAKETNLRRGRNLRDHCPFSRDDDDDDEQEGSSAPVPEDDDDRVEEAVPPVEKTGLPFDTPAGEAEFVTAVVSRHLLKDDFENRCAFERSCERFMQQQGRDGYAAGCRPEPKRKVTFAGCDEEQTRSHGGEC